MVITTTAAGFLVLTVGLAVCGWLFLRAFKKSQVSEDDRQIGLLLSLMFIGFAIQNGEMGIGTLFFANSSQALYYVLLINNFLLLLLNLLSIYTIYHIFFPKISPRFTLLLGTVMGILALIITIIAHPRPFITAKNSIDLDFSSLPLAWMTFYLLFVSIGSNAYIFTKLFFRSTARGIKVIAFVLSFLAIFGIVNIFIRLIVLHNIDADISSRIFDAGLSIIGLSFVIGLGILPIVKNWL